MSASASARASGDPMDVEEYLAWSAGIEGRWELFDGEPRQMAAATVLHGRIQSELARLIGNHLVDRGGTCSVITTPGVVPGVAPGIDPTHNFRIPDLGVTCTGYADEEQILSEPVLLIEILSPGNQARTWINVWTYTTIPSVTEILVLRTDSIRAYVLRRQPDGEWPTDPTSIVEGDLALESIGLRTPLASLYRGTRFVQTAA